MFGAYSCLVQEPYSINLPDLITHYRKLFPSNGFTTHHLCISHEMRIKINKKENQRLAPDDAELLTVKGSQTARCAAQSMLIWPGIKLLGCLGRSRKGVRNSCNYTVKSCADNIVTFEEVEHTFTYEEIKDVMRLSHCQTFASAQGTEFEGSLTLHELSHPRFTKRHLFVGLSRARAAELVCCV